MRSVSRLLGVPLWALVLGARSGETTSGTDASS